MSTENLNQLDWIPMTFHQFSGASVEKIKKAMPNVNRTVETKAPALEKSESASTVLPGVRNAIILKTFKTCEGFSFAERTKGSQRSKPRFGLKLESL